MAVKVTEAPYIDGFADEVNETEDDCSTFCVSVVDVLELSLESPA